ncbi:hypothetical protein [Streptomyces griseosporeus]|uniref:hypothetical protein n=1 Tax=Streptomyces griseosporeus TaxID=1910 RepID=UPI0036FF207F
MAGAVLLSGCSDSGGSDDGADGGGSPTAGPSSTATAGTGGGTAGPSASGDGLEGSWLATTGGKAVVLVVTGTDAGVFTTGGTVCSGTTATASGARTIRLKCNDGSTDRTSGTVAAIGKSSLKVTWKGGLGTETFTRAEGAELPPGLPTPSLGS